MRSHEIELLLPQRDPFLFVDELMTASTSEITGTMTYDQNFPFYQEHRPKQMIVPVVLLIESLVQCGGAGVNKLGITDRALWALASLEKVRILGVVEPDSTVTMVVQNEKLSGRMIKQSGESFCNGRSILKATWFCLRLKSRGR
ncbi:3-hydroxyacyl-ACP dehydratase [Anaerospora sp.]|uniref:3-hydroxyacyl-ACP dehydratase FabZ family protein n=1 Tax=Anaerospora sp. TaxID=1960278 RepID=UPI0028990DE7|nr:3-hydroxyacyl-ACP dehydratase [Anaerospora sp.]